MNSDCIAGLRKHPDANQGEQVSDGEHDKALMKEAPRSALIVIEPQISHTI